MILYISGCYTTGDTEANVKHARQVGAELFKIGHVPVIPHTMYHGMEKYSHISYEDFMTADIRILTRCDGILMLNGWQQSHGAKRERQVALLVGMVIHFESTFFRDSGKEPTQ